MYFVFLESIFIIGKDIIEYIKSVVHRRIKIHSKGESITPIFSFPANLPSPTSNKIRGNIGHESERQGPIAAGALCYQKRAHLEQSPARYSLI